MMKKINLLPLEERQSKWPVNRLFLASGMLVVIVLGSIYSYQLFTLWNIENKLQDTRNQYELLRPTRESMVRASQKEELINKKSNILGILSNQRKSQYSNLEHIIALTSPELWFTDIGKANGGMIQIKGWATNYNTVTEFMRKMEQDQYFTEPVLIKVEDDASLKVIRFEIMVKPKGI